MTYHFPNLSRSLRFLFWAGVACWCFTVQGADAPSVVLHLRNGDRLTGTIASEDSQRVVLTTLWAKEVVVPVAEISKREPVAAKTEGQAANQPAPPAGPPPALPVPPPAPGIKPAPPKYWAADVQLGIDLGFSENNRQLYTGRTKVTYARDRFRNVFDYSFTYGRTDGILSANRMDGLAKTDFDLGKRIYVYNLGGGGYDEIREIAFRYEVGPGFGYHLIRQTNFVLNAEAGVNYQGQHLSDGAETELFYYRFAQESTWTINSRLTVDERLEFTPRVENFREYRMRFEANLRYWLLHNISLNLTVFDLYETDPARNVSQNDLQVRSSIGVKF